jgi:hypothetical protein
MSFQITTAFVNQYTTNVKLLLQQMGSKLEGKVDVQTHQGEAAVPVEQVGAVIAQAITTRHGDTPLVSTPSDRRWVYPTPYGWGDLIDQEDRVRMLIDPQSPYAQNGAKALGRAMDFEILSGMYGTNNTGHTGTTQVSLATYNSGSQLVAVGTGSSSATGLNVDKLKAAMQIFLQGEVDVEMDALYGILTAVAHQQLLNEAQAISLDYNDKPVLVSGRIMEFMGFEFCRMELNGTSGGVVDVGKVQANTITTSSTSNRNLAFWAKSGVHLGKWRDIATKIDLRIDKRYATQVYVEGMFGGTRTEEKKVALIDCTES